MNVVRAEVRLFFVGLPHRGRFPTLVVEIGVEKLAILAAVEVNTAVFTGICSFDLVDQLSFAATGMAIKHRRVHTFMLYSPHADDKPFHAPLRFDTSVLIGAVCVYA